MKTTLFFFILNKLYYYYIYIILFYFLCIFIKVSDELNANKALELQSGVSDLIHQYESKIKDLNQQVNLQIVLERQQKSGVKILTWFSS